MTTPYVPTGAGGGATAAAAVANAIKASGAIIRMDPVEFVKVLAKTESPVVVTAKGGFFSRKFVYLTSYKGLFFHTQSATPLQLPYKAELIAARSIWAPY